MELNKIIQGDCLEVLKTLPDESVDCVITSPPYWALRDYGVEGQLGLEPTFQEYITKLCDIFDEVRRVLKKEGTCWVNLGDTYGGTGDKKDYKDPKYAEGRNGQVKAINKSATQKSLCQIPSRFAIEMSNRGWILRNEIIWHKPNCMPSSVKDRFTVDFEKVFFFVKSKRYHFEQQLEKMLTKDISSPRGSKGVLGEVNSGRRMSNKVKDSVKFFGEGSGNPGGGLYGSTLGMVTPNMEKGLRNKRSVWTVSTKPFRESHFATFPEKLIEPMVKAGCPQGGVCLDVFMGAGTTAVVAKKLGRDYLGIELNPEYIKIAEARINSTTKPLF